MNKSEYKQIVSVLLSENKRLNRACRALTKSCDYANDEALRAANDCDTKNRELISFATRNAELSARCKALEARDVEVAALRQQHAESYTREGI